MASHGRLDEAADLWSQQESILQDLADLSADARRPWAALAEALAWHGWTFLQHDRLDEAADRLAQAMVIYQDLTDGDPRGSDAPAQLATLHAGLAVVFERLGQTNSKSLTLRRRSNCTEEGEYGPW